MLSKKENAKKFLTENLPLFACPKCQKDFTIKDNQLVCQSGHSFEISKKGTVYFLDKKIPTEYTEEMFQHRKNVILNQLYEPLIKELVQWCNEPRAILDVGCGEGSFLKKIGDLLPEAKVKIGFDISKEGINLASQQDIREKNYFYCNADLTNLPFQNESIGTILNIFSPSNYKEFKRVLQKKGTLLKVIPGENYLKEIRQSLYEGKKSSYSNEPVLKKLHEEVTVLEEKHLEYSLPVGQFFFPDLVKMTPLSWSASPEKTAALYEKPFSEITVDVTLVKCQL